MKTQTPGRCRVVDARGLPSVQTLRDTAHAIDCAAQARPESMPQPTANDLRKAARRLDEAADLLSGVIGPAGQPHHLWLRNPAPWEPQA